jgi:hypothetical protein
MSELPDVGGILREAEHAFEKTLDEVKKEVSNAHAAHVGSNLESGAASRMSELATPDQPAGPARPDLSGTYFPQAEKDGGWPPHDGGPHPEGAGWPGPEGPASETGQPADADSAQQRHQSQA